MVIASSRKKTYARILILLIAATMCAGIAYVAIASHKQSLAPQAAQHTTQPTPLATKPPKEAAIGLPVRLTIPKLNIDTTILHLGLTKEGNMDVPSDLVNTGWYKYGPRPGNVGSAVIAGHLEGVKEKGIFIHLGNLVKGDTISVHDDTGATISFIVREARLYNQDERPAEVFNNTNGSHLNLITCTGTWNNAQQRYSKRLVVFADKSS